MEAPEGTGVDARILHPVASPGRDAMGQFKAHLGYLISPAQRASLSRTRVDQLDPAGLKKDGFELSLDRTRHWFGVPRRSAYYRLAVAQESGSRRNRRYWSRSSLRRSRRSAAATRRAGMSSSRLTSWIRLTARFGCRHPPGRHEQGRQAACPFETHTPRGALFPGL